MSLKKLLADPRVEADVYIVWPSCVDRLGSAKHDYALTVVNGHAYGWSIRRGSHSGSTMAMNKKGQWIPETRGSGHNKPRRWTLKKALEIALDRVDKNQLRGMTAEQYADHLESLRDGSAE